MTERPEPGARLRAQLGPILLLASAFLAIIIFLPPEGRISIPLRDALGALLGRAAFILPLGCAFVGALMLVRTLRPEVPLPRRRLVGVGLLLIAVLACEQLLAGGNDGAGLVGRWLSSLFIDLLGVAVTLLLLLIVLSLGTWLAFDLHVPRPRVEKAEARAES